MLFQFSITEAEVNRVVKYWLDQREVAGKVSRLLPSENPVSFADGKVFVKVLCFNCKVNLECADDGRMLIVSAPVAECLTFLVGLFKSLNWEGCEGAVQWNTDNRKVMVKVDRLLQMAGFADGRISDLAVEAGQMKVNCETGA